MGFLHQKIYAVSLLSLYAADNQHLNQIIAAYRDFEYPLSEYGSFLSDQPDFAGPIQTICRLCGTAEDGIDANLDAATRERLQVVLGETPQTNILVASLIDARTPFDCITLVKQLIEELVQSAGGRSGTRATGSDELLPLLAYCIVQAGALDLESLLFYMKTFTQSSLGPQYEYVQPIDMCMLYANKLVQLVSGDIPSRGVISTQRSLQRFRSSNWRRQSKSIDT